MILVETYICRCGNRGDLPEPMPVDIAQGWECPDCTAAGIGRWQASLAEAVRTVRSRRVVRQREVRSLRAVATRAYLSGYTYTEIGKTLGRTRNSIVSATRKRRCAARKCEHWEDAAGLCPWHFYEQWEQTGTCPLSA